MDSPASRSTSARRRSECGTDIPFSSCQRSFPCRAVVRTSEAGWRLRQAETGFGWAFGRRVHQCERHFRADLPLQHDLPAQIKHGEWHRPICAFPTLHNRICQPLILCVLRLPLSPTIASATARFENFAHGSDASAPLFQLPMKNQTTSLPAFALPQPIVPSNFFIGRFPGNIPPLCPSGFPTIFAGRAACGQTELS